MSAFTSSGYMARSGIAGSYDDLVFLSFFFFSNFYYRCTVYIPTSKAQGLQFLPVFTITCCLFWIVAFLMGMKWYLIVVVLCTSLMKTVFSYIVLHSFIFNGVIFYL